jgi:hypothetical protein
VREIVHTDLTELEGEPTARADLLHDTVSHCTELELRWLGASIKNTSTGPAHSSADICAGWTIRRTGMARSDLGAGRLYYTDLGRSKPAVPTRRCNHSTRQQNTGLEALRIPGPHPSDAATERTRQAAEERRW